VLLEIIRKDGTYVAQFKAVFGVDSAKIGVGHATKAIASYERTLIAGDSPFDRYQYGGDKSARSAEAIRGMAIFRGKAKCSLCHTIGLSHAAFTDNNFHNLGVGFDKVEPRLYELVNAFRNAIANGESVDEIVLKGADVSQLGRVLVTISPSCLDDTQDVGRFKTPTLRNVELTAPYMHGGSLPSLEAVIDLYNKGNKKESAAGQAVPPARPQRSGEGGFAGVHEGTHQPGTAPLAFACCITRKKPRGLLHGAFFTAP
jgi:cytochrome c peroxidase